MINKAGNLAQHEKTKLHVKHSKLIIICVYVYIFLFFQKKVIRVEEQALYRTDILAYNQAIVSSTFCGTHGRRVLSCSVIHPPPQGKLPHWFFHFHLRYLLEVRVRVPCILRIRAFRLRRCRARFGVSF